MKKGFGKRPKQKRCKKVVLKSVNWFKDNVGNVKKYINFSDSLRLCFSIDDYRMKKDLKGDVLTCTWWKVQPKFSKVHQIIVYLSKNEVDICGDELCHFCWATATKLNFVNLKGSFSAYIPMTKWVRYNNIYWRLERVRGIFYVAFKNKYGKFKLRYFNVDSDMKEDKNLFVFMQKLKSFVTALHDDFKRSKDGKILDKNITRGSVKKYGNLKQFKPLVNIMKFDNMADSVEYDLVDVNKMPKGLFEEVET